MGEDITIESAIDGIDSYMRENLEGCIGDLPDPMHIANLLFPKRVEHQDRVR